MEQDGHKVGLGEGQQEIHLPETLEVSNRGRGRAGAAASFPGYAWDHHREFTLIATLCWREGLMMGLGMLHHNLA